MKLLQQHKHCYYHKGSQNKAGMARFHASSSSSRSSSSSSNVGVELCNLAMVALLLLILLPSAALGRPHQAFSSTGAHGQESKDAALSLPREQEQQQLQPPPDLDYLPLEQIPSNLKRRSLSGPGSSPPQCTSKCGRCLPCKPVHVPIQPGLVKTAEYYPEAWRCKCGNKLFMP